MLVIVLSILEDLVWLGPPHSPILGFIKAELARNRPMASGIEAGGVCWHSSGWADWHFRMVADWPRPWVI